MIDEIQKRPELFPVLRVLADRRPGGVWSSADPARSLGLSEPTVRRYLDLLSGALVVR